MRVISIRGAITVEKNTSENILDNTTKLLETIIKKNNIKSKDIISVLFTATSDIDSAYPAKAARQMGLLDCSLLCFQEMYVKDSLSRCIRVLLMLNSIKSQTEVNHIYLKEAKVLRKDI
ncbi:chorismate mutase [Senegalia massiliensis]|uniref:chorismate mutase n=1 Tax=Senegalia massiliensis TaxID=1720316 RepID=A0A845QYJ7_9CLOT|nr:chorismate mutase [Senegalia massiliensis]NBI06596.1 chorismate mutase [Senegalia massiliensis]